ncbi:oxidoreductase [Nocardioides dongxiaopingii]|uniref:WD40/YVTN/BNR-like repeat-containing protein n=1 Tax=Nocardioides sp. S-1144 TaxID=2582905 RepID=UPI0011628D8E|nr:oxidoreductase [Nocardioides sp. S-1144]QDH10843.1 oxidoreductase [Nocardioides sp. S-1144]
MRRTLGTLAALLLAVGLVPGSTSSSVGAEPGSDPARTRWKPVPVDTDQQLRGLDAVSGRVAWVGGSEGGVWRTTDAGATWQDVSPPGADGLLFRDIEAADARTALAMTIGEGRDSRIYRTDDAGRTWTRTFVNRDPRAFYDCLAMWPGDRRGLAMSDPVNGRFRILSTTDGGRSWRVLPRAGMPRAEGEFGFAASGTCLVTAGRHRAYLASGGARARVFATRDDGRTWRATDSTLPASEAGGVFSLAFRGRGVGVAVGGDFELEDDGVDRAALTRDGGRTWTNAGDLSGYRSGVDFWRSWVVAVGPGGVDVSRDRGRTWKPFRAGPAGGYDSVQCVPAACWASGPAGQVARLVVRTGQPA